MVKRGHQPCSKFVSEIRFLRWSLHLLDLNIDGKVRVGFDAISILQFLWRLIISGAMLVQMFGRLLFTGMAFLEPYRNNSNLTNFDSKLYWVMLVISELAFAVIYLISWHSRKMLTDVFVLLSREVDKNAGTAKDVYIRTFLRMFSLASLLVIILSPLFCIISCINDNDGAFADLLCMDKIIAQIVSDVGFSKFFYYLFYYANVIGIVVLSTMTSFLGFLFLMLCFISKLLFDQLSITTVPHPKAHLSASKTIRVDIENFLRRHQALSELVGKINDNSCYPMFCWMVVQMIFIIISFVFLNDRKFRSNIGKLLNIGFACSINLFFILVFTIAGAILNERIKESSANKDIVAQCLMEEHEDIHEEYHLYLTKINMDSIGITFGGLFLMDRNFAFTIAGTIFSYITVLQEIKARASEATEQIQF